MSCGTADRGSSICSRPSVPQLDVAALPPSLGICLSNLKKETRVLDTNLVTERPKKMVPLPPALSKPHTVAKQVLLEPSVLESHTVGESC